MHRKPRTVPEHIADQLIRLVDRIATARSNHRTRKITRARRKARKD